MKKNLSNKTIFTLFIFYCCCIIATASDLNLNFCEITRENGLSDNRYKKYIFEDSRGFIWISSIDGLDRYDGMRMKTYGTESGMKGTNIQSNFFEDENKNIWFSTYKAIHCYNADLDTFFNYRVTNNENDTIFHNYRIFHLDTEEQLWLLADNYIYKLNYNFPKEFVQLPKKTTAQFFSVGLHENGSIKKIVAHLNYDSVEFINPEKPEKARKYNIKNSNKSIQFQNSKWLFYYNDQIIVFDENSEKIRLLKNEIGADINDIVLFENKLLCSTNDNGILLYDWKNEKILQQWKHRSNNPFSLLTNSPRDLYISPSNYLWCSHRNVGVDYSYLFNNNLNNPISNLTNDDVEVTSIIEVDNGNVCVSTKYNGVFIFDSNNKFYRRMNHPIFKTGLLQLCKNSKEEIFAIGINYIAKLDIENMLSNTIFQTKNSMYLKRLNNIYPNRKLVATSKGIMELVEEANATYKLQNCREFSVQNELNFLQIHQTKNHKVLIPYKGNELWIYEAKRNGLSLIGKNNSCNIEFFGFHNSKKQPGLVWAGTSNGLKKIENDNSIKPVLIDNSKTTTNKIYEVVEDDSGILWLTTNKGLLKYNPQKPEGKPIHFEEADGLSGELFSLYHSTLYSSDGSIWMGNNKGLVKFHPDSIKVHKEVPKLHLEELMINDTKSFRKSISADNILNLNYEDNTITFDIRAVNLYKTKQNKIHYYLEGYDNDTLTINNGEKIRYTKIKPGQYQMKAQAEDANGHKGNFQKILTININSPWWQTWWFYALCSLFALLIIFTMYRIRVNNILKEEAKKREIERLEANVLLEKETKQREIEQLQAKASLKEEEKKTELEKLKNQVLDVEMKALRAQMNPHFLFNSLNSIKSLILKTKEKEASEYLSKFSNLLRSILNNSEKQKIKLNEEIEALRLYIDLEALRFDSDFNYQIQIDKTIDSGFVRIPPLILQPFVENAIWHGLLPKIAGDSNPKLNINIIRNGDCLFFEIEDNGVGRKKASTIANREHKKSYGIEITKKRIQLLHKENDVEIIDLVNDQQQALGTKVVIKLFAPE